MGIEFSPIIAAAPSQAAAAAAMGSRVAHMAFEVGTGLELRVSRAAETLRGGLMVLSDGEGPYVGDVRPLCEAVRRACEAHEFDGVVFDFEEPGQQALEALVSGLESPMTQAGRRLYTYPAYAHCAKNSRILAQCAVVTGTLRQHYLFLKEQYPGRTIVPEIERLARDIPLPQRNEGAHLDRKSLVQLIQGQQVFFSQELVSHYFTYKSATGDTHFVVYDDSRSLLKKMRLAAAVGFDEGFLLYPEVAGAFKNLPEALEEG